MTTQLPIDQEIRSLKQDQRIYTNQLRRSKELFQDLLKLKLSGSNNNKLKRMIKKTQVDVLLYNSLVTINGKSIQQLRQQKADHISTKIGAMSEFIDQAKNGFVRFSDIKEAEAETALSKFADSFLNSIGKNSYKKYMVGNTAMLNFGFSNIEVTEVQAEYVTNFKIISLGSDENNDIIEHIKNKVADEIVKGYFYSNVGNFFADEKGKYSLVIEDKQVISGVTKYFKITLV